ncbi:MAG TPA: hypothetical protein VIL85_03395 [Thermomicrobiales bacterium]|jgi:hypothetical protein
MWAELVRYHALFDSAVLTGRDAAGYPFSVRCVPRPDAATRTLRLTLLDGTPLVPGPSSIIWHSHDEQLSSLRNMNLRGTLERDAAGWFLRPLQLLPLMGLGNPLAVLPFLIGAYRTTKRYLAKRGLPRPAIPWAKINEAKRHAEMAQRAR